MPCRGPSDSELYREASEKLAQEQGLHQETEETLCQVSTLLIRILRNPDNSIQLSKQEQEMIPEIEVKHLVHRTQELSLRKRLLIEEKQEKQWELEELKASEHQAKENGFSPTACHIAKLSRIKSELEDLQQKIDTLGKILESIENGDESSTQKVLTERIMGY